MSTHVPPQDCTGAPPKHVVPHVPELQPMPVGHGWLQLPQFAPSELVFTHTPLQSVAVLPPHVG